MASIRFGGGVSEIRGSIAGNTFSRNANGAYSRNRIKGVNPQTSAQTAQRARLTALSSAWRDLTDAQRKTWIDGKDAFPYKNRLGESATYTGPQLFNALNMALLSIGEPQIDSCPSPVSAPATGSGTLSLALTTGVLTEASVRFDAAVPADWVAQVFASVPVSAGRSATSTSKRLIASVPGTGVDVDFATEYVAKYGSPAAGSNIIVEVKLVSTVTGQSFVAFTGFGTVA